ncbi:MAG: hypothetical protein K0U52_12655 [Gammaproteobacteria bacterium]|nr:hypothetical protein [Gammaproteobacteria bacterium]
MQTIANFLKKTRSPWEDLDHICAWVDDDDDNDDDDNNDNDDDDNDDDNDGEKNEKILWVLSQDRVPLSVHESHAEAVDESLKLASSIATRERLGEGRSQYEICLFAEKDAVFVSKRLLNTLISYDEIIARVDISVAIAPASTTKKKVV